MPKNARFWRNMALIGLAHLALITGLVRWSRGEKTVTAPSVLWMSGGPGDGAVTATPARPTQARKTSIPEPELKTEKSEEPEEERPVLASAKSEIQLPVATPKPLPRSTSTPKPSPAPSVKATPKPTPKQKPKPKPTVIPKQKLLLAKASPKPLPKAKPTPEETDENDDQARADANRKEISKTAAKTDPDQNESAPKKSVVAHIGSGKGTARGAGNGHADGAAVESQFGWYGNMLHDRFYSEWVQPTTVASAGGKNSVLVKLRIEKDGRVSNFEVVRPSGNAELDESVKALASRVTRVEPLPDGLGNGDHYDVKINFELNSE